VGFSSPAAAGDVAACGNFSSSTDTRFDITGNILTSITSGSCLTFPSNSVVYLNGHTVGGFKQEDPTIGITIGHSSFVWGPGNIRRFGIGIRADHDVAIEHLLVGPVGIGILMGDSYKVREVRIRNCVTSAGQDIGMLLGQGGFIESSIVRDCRFGVVTGSNNKIWNLVISKHLLVGLIVGAGNAVSRTVISSPESWTTIGLDYRGCGTANAGCQDGSNSVQDHCDATVNPGVCGGTAAANLNILSTASSVVTDGATNCGGQVIPFNSVTDLVTANC
jgi:hypothetical protein